MQDLPVRLSDRNHNFTQSSILAFGLGNDALVCPVQNIHG